MVSFFRNLNTSAFLSSLLFAGTLSSCRIQHNPAPVPNVTVPQSFVGRSSVGRTDSSSIGEWPHQALFTDAKLVA
ncbi:hypothetical protein [Spirosoma telluris]|uniref:hypothetical protein n=1 Tax=Spirosoma telluris TaxID=2183553 RepID=UPI002FC29F43